MKHAYIENNVVKEVARVDPFSIFQTAYAALFVPCPDEVEAGWTVDDGAFTAPVPVMPTRTRTHVLAELAILDTKSIRALCEQDADRLAALEAQKVALRNELRAM